MQGPGAFIDQSFTIYNKTIFNLTATIFADVIFAILLIYIILFFRHGKFFIKNMITRLFIYYLILLLIIVAISILRYSNTNDIFLTARYLIYVPIGYLIWIKIYSSLTRNDFLRIFKLILYINIISSILYVLNSAQILNIFPKENIYQEIQVGRRFFYRDFSTIPIFAFFLIFASYSYLLSGEKIYNNRLIVLNLFLSLAVLLFSFTRNVLLSSVAGLFLITIIYILSKNNSKNTHKTRILYYLVILIIFSGILIYAFYDQFLYFSSRIENALIYQSKESNIDVRIAYTVKTLEILNYTGNTFLGAGFTKIYYDALGLIGAFAADSTLPILLIHSGILGTIFLYIVFFLALVRILEKVTSKSWIIISLGSMLLMNFLFSILMSSLISFPIFSMNYWALAQVENNNLWQKEESQIQYEDIGNNITL
jgi:hypothetical protein